MSLCSAKKKKKKKKKNSVYSCKSDDEHIQIQTGHNFPGELFDDAGFFVGNLFLHNIQNFPLCETR